MRRALVVGLGVSGESAARHLARRGVEVVALDDRPSGPVAGRAAALGVELVASPEPDTIRSLVAGVDAVVPSPGVPLRHPVFALAAEAGVPVVGEVELAYRAARQRLVAVTGTNGKTTVTSLVAEMLKASGVDAVAAGNIGLPLTDAVETDAEVLVAEVSSFQLQFVETFSPAVAVWLNLAADHLDWHPDLESYVAAKARVWRRQRPSDVAVVNADDPVVVAEARSAPSRVVTFGLEGSPDYRVASGWLRAEGRDLVPLDGLARALPHDVANALAASAAALASGATVAGVAKALSAFRGLPHRLTLVAEGGGVRWYDDSKATNPHAAAAAVSAFDSVVLLAGGRNKGLDLGALAGPARGRVRRVVALGEAADDVRAAFAGICPVQPAAGMQEAVELAAAAAGPGDVVLLSPGCASFDWYESYAARGDDFAERVRRLVGSG